MTDRETHIFRNFSQIAEHRERQGRNLQAQEMARLFRAAFGWLSARRQGRVRRGNAPAAR